VNAISPSAPCWLFRASG